MRATLLAFLLLAASPAAAQDSAVFDREISECRTYATCIRLMDSYFPSQSELYAPQLAAKLQTFGDRAKRELLARATADVSKVTNSADLTFRRMVIAGAVLGEWDNWTAADLPALRRAIENNPESKFVEVLANMRTPEALRMVVEFANSDHIDLLKSLGDTIAPYLFDAFDSPIWSNTAYLVHDLPELAVRAAPSWLALAQGRQQPSTTRVKALRALAASAAHANRMRDNIAALRSDPDIDVRREAFHALREMGDLGAAAEIVEFCPRASDPFTSDRWDRTRPQFDDDLPDWGECVRDIAWLDDEALPYGDRIADKFLNSPNGIDRTDGASVLGFIGYRPAIPKLIALLDDPDWHVVYASARALRWLQASGAIPALQRVAATHWLPDIRAFAGRVIATLQVPDQGTIKPERGTRKRAFVSEIGNSVFGSDTFSIHATVLSIVDACQSERWRWGTREFSWPIPTATTTPLRFQRLGYTTFHDGFAAVPINREGRLPAGDLIGYDQGEFGGSLSWQPNGGTKEELYRGNVNNVLPASDGAVALFSLGGVSDNLPVGEDKDQFITLPDGERLYQSFLLSNYPLGDGMVLHVVRDSSGKWQLTEAARLIQGRSAIGAIGPDLYAAWSAGRVIVFDTQKILGLAECTSPP